VPCSAAKRTVPCRVAQDGWRARFRCEYPTEGIIPDSTGNAGRGACRRCRLVLFIVDVAVRHERRGGNGGNEWDGRAVPAITAIHRHCEEDEVRRSNLSPAKALVPRDCRAVPAMTAIQPSLRASDRPRRRFAIERETHHSYANTGLVCHPERSATK